MTKIAEHEICLLFAASEKPWSSDGHRFDLQAFFGDDVLLREASETRAPDNGPAKWMYSGSGFADGGLENEPIWKLDENNPASADLIDPIRSLVDGSDIERVKLFSLNTTSAACRRAVDLLLGNGTKSSDPNLFLHLRTTASNYLKAAIGWNPVPIELKLAKPRLHLFRSGASILELKVQIQSESNCAPELFLEVLNALTRFNDLSWGGQNNTIPNYKFRLGDIARALLEGPGTNVRAAERVFSASYCRVSGFDTPSHLTEFAVRTAKQYPSHYDVAEHSKVEVSLSQTFDGKVRATAPEGCSVIVRDEETEFIKSYRVNTWCRSYLPIALLALHEKEAWAKLAADSAQWLSIDEGFEDETLTSLSAIRRRALQVRTAYSSPRISQVADHDAWKLDLENRLRIPELRIAVADDLAATESAIREDAERKRRDRELQQAERYKWVTIMAGASVAGIAAFTMATELFQASGTGKWAWGMPRPSEILKPTFLLPCIAFACAFAPAAIYIRKKFERDD